MIMLSRHTSEPYDCISLLRSPFRRVAVVTVLVVACRYATAADHAPPRKDCLIDEKYTANLDFSGRTDIGAARAYKETAAQMLKDKRYYELDYVADSARSTKETLPGGRWKLDVIYAGLDSPVISPVHATEQDWNNHLKNLRRWVSARPRSVTARVALASAMSSYAWYARGNGLADTVSNSGWKLFGERMAESKRILEAAWKLPVKCPEWYFVMQDIAVGQGWDDASRRALFDRAVQFEPDYYPYYQAYATSILPKWGGEVGAAASFLQESADRFNGDGGDILYFQVAARLTCGCNDDQELGLSWPRIQRGFEAFKRQRGTSMENLNLLARVAIKNRDAMIADRLFSRIGDQWSEEVWVARPRFESSRKWASQWSPTVTPLSKTESDDGNTKFDSELRFRTAWKEKIAFWMQKCLKDNPSDVQKFDLFLQFSIDGKVEQTFASNSSNPASCVLRELAEVQKAGSLLVAIEPTHPPRALRFEVDPVDFTSIASK